MSAGTITLTNNSAAVSGAGTVFTTDLKAGDFIVSVVGGVTYTLPVKTVNSATGVTLLKNYDGPTQAGAAWSAVPRDTMNAITAQLAVETSQALRGLNYDKQNWQQVFSSTGTATVRLPDGSSYTGPAWGGITTDLNGKLGKDKNLSDIENKTLARKNLELGKSSLLDVIESIADTSTSKLALNGVFGWGGVGAASFPGGSSWAGSPVANGVYSGAGASSVDHYAPYAALLHCVRNSSSLAWQMQVDASGMGAIRGRQNGQAGLWSSWNTIYTNGNTTVDSNGFIKKASPIIKIFHDGRFDVNAESEGASVEREGVGIYRISNILGMNSDGAWGGIDGGFEVPTDRNGQRLVWLDYKVDADGSILVKTYHRTYPDAPAFARNIKDGYEEGAPIDIPSDQFLSVRVEMPQDSIWNLAQKAAREAMEQEKTVEG